MHRSHRFLLAPLVLVLALFVGACSDDDDNPVNPPPAGTLNSGTLAPAAVYAPALATAGTYPYHCNFHPSMTGTVTVDASAPTLNAAVTITDFAFTPATVSIQPGGTVTWTNNGANNHTVTSD